MQDPTSLEICQSGEDGDTTWRDLIEAPAADNPHTAAEAAALRDCMAEALARLTPRVVVPTGVISPSPVRRAMMLVAAANPTLVPFPH